ncbi:MAG: hypothetical protein CL910_19520 [Deltaproteobacteria bacterium]|jgi:hypothetical protein|nr:hypothetical protein [Deltaproteobacteria bacterium]
MARIPGLRDDESGWFARFFYRAVRKRSGKVGDSWRIAAHAPGLLAGWGLHEFFYGRLGKVEPALRTLVQIKVAMLVGCPL